MPTTNYPPLTLSGVTYDKSAYDPEDPTAYRELVPKASYVAEPGEEVMDEVETAGSVDLLIRIPFQPGDIRADERLDQQGRWAVAGGYANAGYSGFLKTYVFDGKRWRNLRSHGMYSREASQYAAQQDKPEALERITQAITAMKGRVVVWGDRAYELAPT